MFLCRTTVAQNVLGMDAVPYLLYPPSDRPYANFIFRGNEFYKQGDYRHAILNFNFARELEPDIADDFLFNFKIGYAYKSINSFDSASTHLRKASADPLMGDYALIQLAQILVAQDSVETAIKLHKMALKTFPQTVFYPEATLAIGELLIVEKQYDEAGGYLNLCAAYIKDDPTLKNLYQSRILLQRANILVLKGFFTASLDILRNIQNDHRYTDEAYRAKSLADSLRKVGGVTPAIDPFIDGNNVLILQGYYQQALNELAENKSRFALPEEQAEIEYNIARIYFAQGLYDAAVPRYQNLWNKYRHKESLFNIAKSARYQGDLDLSTSAYRDYRDSANLSSAWKTYITYEIANNFSAKGDSASLRQANRYYAEVREKTPLSALYGYTSAFRTAFNFYKLAEYDSCITRLEGLLNVVDVLKPKFMFWIAKAYEKSGRTEKSQIIYENLAQDRPWNYYGMLSYHLHMDKIRTPGEQLFYTDPGFSLNEKNSFFDFDNIKSQFFRIEQDGNRFYFKDRSLKYLEKEFVKAWISKEILEPRYAQRELQPLQKKYLESLETAILYRNYLEFLEAYDLAVETNVAIKKKYRSKFRSQSESAKLFYPRYYRSVVREYAQKYGLDEPFVFAVIKNESAFKTYSISKARAIGLMQIMPYTGTSLARELNMNDFGMMDLQRPEMNILLGTYYLHQQAKEYKNFIPAMLGAYNAGPHRADFWMRFYNAAEPEEFPEIVELLETNSYIKKILLDRWIYAGR
jgi:soluble lytic murein transglycosylase